ncbi:MAG: hypothetical protein HOP12_07960 [Candidatus Eisenbacteria bacterium]|uniref:Endonuclease/exonuclease/phosphatase domain-containing protein n=1 Tax=Eiseniibacteriota bacterium TaxID=2212470 RepID=A0A849SYA7_UNCEI|nr:hypothetical protein [Candidatus Eisenbacteria bacterium]
MTRDASLLEECRQLQRAVEPYATLAALHAAPEWSSLAPRFNAVLARVHRYLPPGFDADASASEHPAPIETNPVNAVHWNIEHGNWFDLLTHSLREHPSLRDADLLMMNEVDLGMARAGNRDVTAELCGALGRHGVWGPMFLETTLGRDDDLAAAAGRTNEESLFGLSILSRWPIGNARVVELPSPEALQFDLERMVGRHVALIAEILRPGAPFVAVTAHLEVHRTRAHRAAQVQAIVEALRGERRPIVMSGDFNTHTFDRGEWHSALLAGLALLATPGPWLERRLLWPDRGPMAEPLFEILRTAGFAWEPWVDFHPTLQLRIDRVDESRAFWLLDALAHPVVAWAGRRGKLRLDWFAGRGWPDAAAAPSTRGRTLAGLDGPGKASDHAPIVAHFG